MKRFNYYCSTAELRCNAPVDLLTILYGSFPLEWKLFCCLFLELDVKGKT